MHKLLRALLTTLALLSAPLAQAEIQIVLDPSLDPKEAAFATQAIRTAERLHLERFGFTFPDSVRAVISGDPGFLARDYARRRGAGYAKKRAAFAEWITGEATWRGIYVNTSSPRYHVSADTTVRNNRQRLYSHELFHVMQYELAGSRSKKCCPANSSREVGPIWMMEGAASYFAMSFEGARLRNYVRYAERQVGNLGGQSLAALATRNAMRAVESSYGIGAYAVHLLVEQHGAGSIPAFYAGLRRGGRWPRVFEATFGEPVEAFYARFN